MVFIQPINLEHRLVEVTDVDFAIHGYVLDAHQPLNIRAINIDFDFDWAEGGWIYQPYCNYPEARMLTEIYYK
jgi:hypothetical protein